MNELIGRELGPYRILELIGTGGMATVYKAYHATMDRYVAIKVLPEQMSLDTELCKRFDREVKVIGKLTHAHILPVHDYGLANNRLYMVMRYVQAGTLKDLIAAGPMDLDELNRIMQQVGGALAHGHRQGVIHRDVKPSNVLVDDHRDCYLTDFGLARIMESSVQLTASGVGIGTPAYMSPEQGEGRKADPRSDIYSLGVMLYEMATGQVPYEAETPMAVILKHITAPLPLPRSVKPDVPEQVERVILKTMAKDPNHRFQTIEEMLSALDTAVQLARPDPWLETIGSAPTSVAAITPPIGGPMARIVAYARKAKTSMSKALLPVAISVIALLIVFIVWAIAPFRIQVSNGQLTVGWAVTATVQALGPPVIETTASPTPTPPSTRTATPFLRNTATETSIPTVTSTHTLVPTATSTRTPVPTSTPSPTPRPTATRTKVPTSTPSPTPRPTATPAPVPVDVQVRTFADPILSAIANRSPDFEDDFSTADRGWDLHIHGEAGPKDRLEIIDGVVRMTLFDGAIGVLNHDGLTHRSFVIEFDFRQVSDSDGARQSFYVRIPDGGIGLTVESDTGSWNLSKWYSKPYDDRHVVRPIGEPTSVVIVVRGPQLAVYLSHVPVAYVRDQVLDLPHDTWFMCEGLPDTVCEFDNVRVWNLDNVPGLP